MTEVSTDPTRQLSVRLLDHERETSLDELLAAVELPVRQSWGELGWGGAAAVIDLTVEDGCLKGAHACRVQAPQTLSRLAPVE